MTTCVVSPRVIGWLLEELDTNLVSRIVEPFDA